MRKVSIISIYSEPMMMEIWHLKLQKEALEQWTEIFEYVHRELAVKKVQYD
jgi:hypothetical protein